VRPYVQEELFQLPGIHSEVALIRDCLDTGTPDKLRIFFAGSAPECNLHSTIGIWGRNFSSGFRGEATVGGLGNEVPPSLFPEAEVIVVNTHEI